ncbi:MAG: hypothetical protein ACKVRO_14040 [Micropepsaceae bacterium]
MIRLRALLIASFAVSCAGALQAEENGVIATAGDGSFEIRTATDSAAPSDSGSERQIEIRTDALSVEPVLSVELDGAHRTVERGKAAKFAAHTNYPSYVDKAEVRILAWGSAPDAAPIATVAVGPDGAAAWMPTGDAPDNLYYVYRVYDREGRFDETAPKELTLVDEVVTVDGAPVARPKFGAIDEAHVRNIPLKGAATVTVTGQADAKSEAVQVAGQPVKVEDGKFVAQQLVDKGSNKVRVTVERDGKTKYAATRDVKVPKSDWFYVVQGDLTFISSKGKGPAVVVSGDPLADGDHVTARGAFYTKGTFGDDWKLTASLDTGETLIEDLFSNLDRKDARQLLRRLDSNEYYSTYGDDSAVVEDAPTQGSFYLKVANSESSLLFGNFVTNIHQAELAQLDRGLFGGIVEHKSSETTSFGERKLQLTAFASDPGTIPGRDEFRGTGGSLYFLKRQDISIGSERVRIEVRDRDTGLVLQTRELRAQEDYDIDYIQGRVILLKPLASAVADSGTVRESSSAGNVPVLVVRYEFTPAVGDLDGYTIGGRGQAWLGEHVRVGATAQRETTEAADQTLLGADALFRLHAGTYLKAEFARTDGPSFGQANSVDGGLTFNDIASPVGRNANAYRVEAAADFGELFERQGDHGKAAMFYETFDAGFASNGHLTQSDTRRWGASASITAFKDTGLAAKYEELHSDAAGAHRVASADVKQPLGGGFEAKLGVRHDAQVPGLLYNSTERGKRTDTGIEILYKPAGENWSVYGFGQVTLAHDAARRSNNRAGLGAKAELTDRLSLAAELSEGDGGLGADVQLNHRYGDGSEAYVGYSLLAERTQTGLEPANIFTRGNRGTLTAGSRHRFSSAFSVYGENGMGFGASPSTMWRFGAKYDPNERLSFTGSFENGQIDDATTGLFKRTAVTVGAGYTTKGLQAGSSVEARFEDGTGRKQEMFLVRNTASVQVNPDWRALARFNFAIANDDFASVRAADYIEGVAGFAYRPVLNDRLNVLARYSYFRDLGPIGQVTAGGETGSPKQVSQIVSIDANYDLTQAFTIGAKYGYRQGQVSITRASDTFVSSNTHLGVLRADWRPVREWDVVAEGRYLTNDIAGDSRTGALVAVYRHVNDNVKVGVGYSFSDFSDDLTDQSYSSRGVFVNLISKF